MLAGIFNNSKLVGRKLFYVLTLPIVMVVVILKPIVILRFGTLKNDRIGHFAGDTEAYLCAKAHESSTRRQIDIIGCSRPVCNNYLMHMWGRVFKIYPGASVWRILDESCQYWTGRKDHHIPLYDRGTDYYRFIGTRPNIIFNADENNKGSRLLEKLGIPVGKKWVCIHNRDSAYLDGIYGNGLMQHHNHRDFSVEDLMPAAYALASRGYYIIRVGSVSNQRICTDNSMIIDYVNSEYRSDFLDIYLLANCDFFLGNDSGIWCLPLIFRKPLAMVNFNHMHNFFDKNYRPWIVIFKKFFDKKSGKLLTFREIFLLGLASESDAAKFDLVGVGLLNNSTEEILELALEIDDRNCGRWIETPEDTELQNLFLSILKEFSPTGWAGKTDIKIGASFIRKNQYLLN